MAAQRWILREILDKLPVEAPAHGFVRGRSTVTNAAPHCRRDVVVNGPLFPTTDLYVGPANGGAAQAPVGSFTVPANSQIRVGKVLSFNDARLSAAPINYPANLWNSIKGSIVQPSDNRYAWVPFYRRDAVYQNTTDQPLTVTAANIQGSLNSGALLRLPSPYAQVYFLPVAVRNRSTYDVSATSTDLAAGGGNLLPRRVNVQIVYSAAAADYVIQFYNTPANPDNLSVTPGCFVVISDDRVSFDCFFAQTGIGSFPPTGG